MRVLLFVCLSSVGAVGLAENPIRRIVTLLQDMQKEIETEGVKEAKAFDKFLCYCDGGSAGMQDATAKGIQHTAELSSQLEALKAEKAALDQELADHHQSRASAKQDAQKAATLRAKEHAEFEAQASDMSQNIAAMKGAVAALEKGTSFVQTSTEFTAIQHAVSIATQVDDFEKQSVLDFLQGKQGSESTAQIIGMLKAMQDEMEGDLSDTESTEASAANAAQELAAAKNDEIKSATAAIEAKTKRSGELAVEVVQTSDDLEDTQADVAESQKFLSDLDAQCASKKAQWASRQQTRADEIAAVGEAIKILNDDDALDLFKKTASLVQTPRLFLQKGKAKTSAAKRARGLVLALAQTGRSHQTMFSLIAATMQATSVDFSKVVEKIDGMVKILGQEQTDDDQQRDFCESELEKTGREKTDTEGQLESLARSIEDMTATAAQLASEIESLQAEIKMLDSTVAEATEQRKSEHEAYLQSQSENQAAQEILGKAKNRLLQFYRPGQHQPEEAVSFAQVRAVSDAVPPPPPETFGAYTKKEGKSNGVMGLMDQMAGELKTDHTDAEHAEDIAQREYEALMGASQKTRASNAKSITEKESAKAEWQSKLEDAKGQHSSTAEQLSILGETIRGLHQSCDFIMENFDARKQARTAEVEGLKNAKAVLSGASFE